MQNDELQEVQPDTNEQVEVELEAIDDTQEDTQEENQEEVDWKAEALKYKAIAHRQAKKIKGGTPNPKQELPTDVKRDEDLHKTVERLSLAETKRQFGYEHNLSPEETDAVFKITPNPTKETLEDPFVKGGLATLRAKRKVQDNIPSTSNRSSFNLPKKEGLTTQEKQEEFDKFVQKRFKK